MDYNAARANLDNTPFLDNTMLQHHPVMMRNQVVMKDHGAPWPDQANTSSSYTDQLMARTNPEIPVNRSIEIPVNRGFDMTTEGPAVASNGRASASLRSSLRSSYANGFVSRYSSVTGVVAGMQKESRFFGMCADSSDHLPLCMSPTNLFTGVYACSGESTFPFSSNARKSHGRTCKPDAASHTPWNFGRASPSLGCPSSITRHSGISLVSITTR